MLGGGAALAVGELILAVHPLGRQPPHDRVLRLADLQILKTCEGPWPAPSPCPRGVRTWRAGGVVDGDAVAEVRLAPAEADHPVELGPLGEGVVGGVDHHRAAAALDEGHEVALHLGSARPRRCSCSPPPGGRRSRGGRPARPRRGCPCPARWRRWSKTAPPRPGPAAAAGWCGASRGCSGRPGSAPRWAGAGRIGCSRPRSRRRSPPATRRRPDRGLARVRLSRTESSRKRGRAEGAPSSRVMGRCSWGILGR